MLREGPWLSVFSRSFIAPSRRAAGRELPDRIVDGEVWLYQQIHAAGVDRPNGTFGFAYYRFHPDLDAFVHEAALEMERVRQRNDIERNPAQT